MRRPSFQFYPADWRKDTALQFCSLAARGLWVELMCIAHECEPYGHLSVNGKPMTIIQIGRLVGISEKECKKLLAELFDAGVPSVATDGAIFSRRMVRDEEIRNKRATGGKDGAIHGSKGASFGRKGGRPAKEKTPLVDNERGVLKPPFDEKTEPPLKPPPSSSSSSSCTPTSVIACSPHLTEGAHEQPPSSTRRGLVCGLLRKAGMADAAPHYLTDETWESILSKRTDEEIVEFARAKMEARPGQRTGLKYIAPALLEDPKPVAPQASGKHSGFDAIDYHAGVGANGRF